MGTLVTDSSGNLYGATRNGDVHRWEPVRVLSCRRHDHKPRAIHRINRRSSAAERCNHGLGGSPLRDHPGRRGQRCGIRIRGDKRGYSAVVTSQPTTVVTGTLQSVTVGLENPGGIVDANNSSAVTLSIASGPAERAIGGTTDPVNAVAGVAGFSGITFSDHRHLHADRRFRCLDLGDERSIFPSAPVIRSGAFPRALASFRRPACT